MIERASHVPATRSADGPERAPAGGKAERGQAQRDLEHLSGRHVDAERGG
jgi:hypothetical protein